MKQSLRVVNTHLPDRVKQYGRTLILPKDWEKNKIEYMYRVVHSKFFSNVSLSRALVRTDNAMIIEQNKWHDNIWGDCTCYGEDCNVIGENNLGIILMSIRDELKCLNY